jgi:ABC-type branched-subunit amino acid transport system substrate-binding protein
VERAVSKDRSRPSRAQVLQSLRSMPAYSGITGAIAFLPNGDRRRSPVFVMRVKTADPAGWLANEELANIEVP